MRTYPKWPESRFEHASRWPEDVEKGLLARGFTFRQPRNHQGTPYGKRWNRGSMGVCGEVFYTYYDAQPDSPEEYDIRRWAEDKFLDAHIIDDNIWACDVDETQVQSCRVRIDVAVGDLLAVIDRMTPWLVEHGQRMAASIPPGQFEDLQEEFYDGVIDTVEDTGHADGLQRVKAATGVAQQLDPTNNALRQVLGVKDKAGICHQLADGDRIKWIL